MKRSTIDVASFLIGLCGAYIIWAHSLVWGIALVAAGLIWRLERIVDGLQTQVNELRFNKQDRLHEWSDGDQP